MITCPILGMNKMSEKVRMDTLKINKCRNKEGGKRRAGRSMTFICFFISVPFYRRENPRQLVEICSQNDSFLEEKVFVSGEFSFTKIQTLVQRKM